MHRRGFLQGATSLLGVGSAAAILSSPSHAAARLSLSSLAEGLWLVQGGAANALIAATDEGPVLIDGGVAPDARPLEQLLKRQFPGKSVRAVFNTHWHPPHSGFNATARKLGVDVIAHENTKLWLSTEVNARWEGRVYPPQPVPALPNRTFFYGPQVLEMGGRRFEYGHLGQAHTDGDIFVKVVDANVIATGDVLAPERYPLVDPASNGWLGGLHTATKTLAARGDSGTKYVPGSGAVCGADTLKAQEELCYTVLQRIGDVYYKGQTYEQLLASNPTREFDASHGDPAQFLKLSWDTAWYHVGEVRRVAR